jgi:hypothetical protein
MTLPDAGWLTDPEDPQQVRWWNGLSWSEQRKDRVQLSAPAQPVEIGVPTAPPMTYVPMAGFGSTPVSQAPATRTEKDKQIRKNNSMAYTGLVLSLVAFLINPFAILSILGIVFSSIGLAKSHELEGAGHKVTGRGTAKTGIVVGILGTIALAYLAFR